MAGYQKPGILVTEVDTPNTTTVLDRPTLIGVVGLALGHETRSEIKYLRDNEAVALAGANITTTPASTFVVSDINSLDTIYAQGDSSDYVLTVDGDGVTYIQRSLHTTMAPTESTVVVIKTTTPSGIVASNVTFDYENDTPTIIPSNGGVVSVAGGIDHPDETDISLQRAGAYLLSSDYEINLSNGRIRRANTTFDPANGGCHIMSGQTVYVSYTTDSGTNVYTDEIVTLTGQTYAVLANESEIVDTDSIVVCNRDNVSANPADVVVFSAGTNGTAGVDFQFSFDDLGAPNNFTMRRNVEGPTTMGLSTNSVNVRIDYKYIPSDYYVPTLFTSYHDLETKYGPAFDSLGNVVSPLSAAAYMAFRSGSNEIVAQALYTLDGNNRRVQGSESDSTHWATTLSALEDQASINVLVPSIGQGSFPELSDNDANDLVSAIHLKFVDHINTMARDNQYVVAIFGEDSTKGGNMITTTSNRGSSDVLRTHAQILGQQNFPERTVLVSPSVFKMANPATGKITYVGGQYAAVSLAGMLARDPVQSALTRKTIPGIIDVGDYRNESEKNADASAGLMVIENKNGLVRVRHAITTAVNDDTKRELNAVRSKFFMIESIKRTLDENVIGRVLTDARAEFIVSTTVAGVLEYMQNTGTITGYGAVGATRSTSSPTSMTVRFAYSLPYPINNIEIALSLDTITGTVNAQ